MPNVINPTDFSQCPRYLDAYLQEDNGQRLMSILIPLPAWNMYSVDTCNFAHGLVGDDIISISVIIDRDDGVRHNMLSGTVNMAGGVGLREIYATATHIYLALPATHIFNNPNYDDAVMSRGKCLIFYVV